MDDQILKQTTWKRLHFLTFPPNVKCQNINLFELLAALSQGFAKSKNVKFMRRPSGYDAFELWCWRRLLRVPWTARRINLYILKEINPEHSLERQILKLRLQYFGHLMRREDSLEKTLMLGESEGKRRRGRQRTRWLGSVIEVTKWIWPNSGRQWKTGGPGILWSMGHEEADMTWLNSNNKQGYPAVARMKQVANASEILEVWHLLLKLFLFTSHQRKLIIWDS